MMFKSYRNRETKVPGNYQLKNAGGLSIVTRLGFSFVIISRLRTVLAVHEWSMKNILLMLEGISEYANT